MRQYPSDVDLDLFNAAVAGNTHKVRKALDAGAKFFNFEISFDAGYGDALMAALVHGKPPSVFDLLLQNYPKNKLVLVPAILNFNDLIRLRRSSYLKFITSRPQEVNLKDGPWTPLLAAAERGEPWLVSALLKAGATTTALVSGMNALEVILARNETLEAEWAPIVKQLAKSGLRVRPKTKVNPANQAFFDSVMLKNITPKIGGAALEPSESICASCGRRAHLGRCRL